MKVLSPQIILPIQLFNNYSFDKTNREFIIHQVITKQKSLANVQTEDILRKGDKMGVGGGKQLFSIYLTKKRGGEA